VADKTELIVSAATTMLPAVVDLIKTLFAAKNPGVPPPTSAEVILALNSAVAKSLAADDFWLASHPKQ
jgi:hypothetical protein